MKTAIFLVLLLASPLAAQKINPSTQINWPAVAASSTPTASCTSANYGQPYTDTATNSLYFCSSGGWIATGGGSMTWPSGTGIPAVVSGTSWGGTYNAGNTIPANFISALPYVGYTGSFTVTHCLEVQATSPLTIEDAGAACGSGSGGATLQTNGTNNTSQSTLNFTDTSTVKFTNPSGGVESATVPTSTASQLGASSPDNSTITATSGVYSAAATVINGTTCTPGGSCAPENAPPVDYIFYGAAVSDGGSANAASCTRYATNQPQTGSINSADSALGYLAFQAVPTNPQYCEFSRIEPPYWTGTSIGLQFLTSVTTGNVTWEVQSVCVPDGTALTSAYSPTFGTAQTTTTTVSSTAYGSTTTAVLSNVAEPGVGNCPSSPTTSTLVTYRIFRSASDTAAADANLLGVDVGSGRSR